MHPAKRGWSATGRRYPGPQDVDPEQPHRCADGSGTNKLLLQFDGFMNASVYAAAFEQTVQKYFGNPNYYKVAYLSLREQPRPPYLSLRDQPRPPLILDPGFPGSNHPQEWDGRHVSVLRDLPAAVLDRWCWRDCQRREGPRPIPRRCGGSGELRPFGCHGGRQEHSSVNVRCYLLPVFYVFSPWHVRARTRIP